MINLKVDAFKAGFFDRDVVLKALGRARAKILKEQGRLVRKRAQASLKYKDGVSAPGRPPHAHKSGVRKRRSRSTGKARVRRVSYLREFLYFAYDATTQSTVVGPARLDGTVDPAALPALEYGGTSRVVGFDGRRRRARIAARPFMGPALAAEAPQFPAMWRDSIR